MRRCKRLDNLQFDNDDIAYDQIRNVIADPFSTIKNGECPLLLMLDANLLQLDRKSVLINRFKKSMPESASYRESALNYPLRQRI